MAEPVTIAQTESAGAIRAPKLASVVAARLEDEIVARGWPVGEVMGSETELLDRFGVSRAVLREAVRIVEHTGAARMRRGPGGGLVVTEPNRGAVVDGMGVWFSYTGATIEELIEARRPLLLAACRLAAARADEERLGVLFARIDEAEAAGTATSDNVTAIEGAIAALAQNPALALFVDSLADVGANRMLIGRARLEPTLTDAEGAIYIAGYRRLAEAIAEGDADKRNGEAPDSSMHWPSGSTTPDLVVRPPRGCQGAASLPSASLRRCVSTSSGPRGPSGGCWVPRASSSTGSV